VLCRNLVFTYFVDELQREVAPRLAGALRPGGTLVLGAHERLPGGVGELEARAPKLGVYRA
jgi:chemotaxis protein methyltransferase CheR